MYTEVNTLSPIKKASLGENICTHSFMYYYVLGPNYFLSDKVKAKNNRGLERWIIS